MIWLYLRLFGGPDWRDRWGRYENWEPSDEWWGKVAVVLLGISCTALAVGLVWGAVVYA